MSGDVSMHDPWQHIHADPNSFRFWDIWNKPTLPTPSLARARTLRRWRSPFRGKSLLPLSSFLSSISTAETVEYVFGRPNLHLHFLLNLNCPDISVSSLEETAKPIQVIKFEFPAYHIFREAGPIT